MKKPEVIDEYNRHMSGINRCDQMVSYYSTLIKSVFWYIKELFHFLDLAPWNANFVYNKDGSTGKMSFVKFRENVIGCLIRPSATKQRSPYREPSQPSASQGGSSLVRASTITAAGHFS